MGGGGWWEWVGGGGGGRGDVADWGLQLSVMHRSHSVL